MKFMPPPALTHRRLITLGGQLADFRFTMANQSVYAFGYRWPSQQAWLVSFAWGNAMIERVNLLGSAVPLSFHQTDEALLVSLPAGEASSMLPYVLRLQGSMPLGFTLC